MARLRVLAAVRDDPVRPGCVFCGIARRTHPASIVWEDDLDPVTGAAVMASVARLTRAVTVAFPHQGLSVWHSIGTAAFQEVPHLHIHVHPRLIGDGLLQVYPSAPATPDEATRDRYAASLRSCLA